MSEANVKPKDYLQLLNAIRTHPILLNSSRHLKIRVEQWLSKLSTNTSNHLWRRNRNNYLQLLYVMLEVGQIIEPFTAMPKSQIPKLHSHQISCSLLALDRKTINQKKVIRMGTVSAQELWVQLQNQGEQRNTMMKKQESRNVGQVGLSILSPIANQQNSGNFSDLTYESLQGQLNQQENEQNRYINTNPKKYTEIKHEKYFKKKQYPQHAKPSTITLLQRIQVFLRKNKETFQEDAEFQKIYRQLKQMNKQYEQEKKRDEIAPNLQSKSNTNNLSGVNYFSKNRGYDQDHYNENGKKHINLIFHKNEEQENCDYFQGEYSQYSDIPFSQGISPQKISDINKFNKYCHNHIPEISDL